MYKNILPIKRVRRYGLQRRITRSYVWMTIAIVFVLQCLNTILLTGSIRYTLGKQAQGVEAGLSQMVSYPFSAALLMFIILMLIASPVGGWFGTLTTRGLVRRIQTLVEATMQIASGEYGQRVAISGHDEIGQLENQFNCMAEQLAESLAQRAELAEQNARLAERARISRELHDAISQDLFSIRMLAYGLQMALPSDTELQAQAATLEQTASSVIREMRALLLEMRPEHLEHLGLAPALEAVAQAYHSRVGVTISTFLTPIAAGPDIEHALLRVAQEALSNAVRHAHATQITLSLKPQKEMITLTIADNGEGFSQDKQHKQYRQHGLGLRLMQERIQELQGTFVLHTVPDQGTCIQVCVPERRHHDSRVDC